MSLLSNVKKLIYVTLFIYVIFVEVSQPIYVGYLWHPTLMSSGFKTCKSVNTNELQSLQRNVNSVSLTLTLWVPFLETAFR